MGLDLKILDVLACPSCKGKLDYDKNSQKLICKFEKLAFPIQEGVPILLLDRAEKIKQDKG